MDIDSKWKELSKHEPLFNAWHIVDYIGSGSFGQVYEIEREEFGRVYRSVLKVISIPQNEDEVKLMRSEGTDIDSISSYYDDLVKSIVEENAIMFELRGHTNIVSYEDHTVIPHEDDIGYDVLIRMEKLTPLIDYFLEREMKEKDVIKLGIDLCQALILCQKKNIIHRDIKPANIFVSDTGDYELGDFGIARTIEKTTTELSKKGTFTYMAPEVYQGRTYGTQADIYSLGIVMYHLMNYNRAPFLPIPPEPISAKLKEESLQRRLFGEPLPDPAKASPELSRIIRKACAYKPEDRYNTANEFQQDLKRLQSEKLKAEKDGDERESEDWMERTELLSEDDGIWTGSGSGTIAARGGTSQEPSERSERDSEGSGRGERSSEGSWRGDDRSERSRRGERGSEASARGGRDAEPSWRGAYSPDPSWREDYPPEPSWRGDYPPEPSYRGDYGPRPASYGDYWQEPSGRRGAGASGGDGVNLKAILIVAAIVVVFGLMGFLMFGWLRGGSDASGSENTMQGSGASSGIAVSQLKQWKSPDANYSKIDDQDDDLEDETDLTFKDDGVDVLLAIQNNSDVPLKAVDFNMIINGKKARNYDVDKEDEKNRNVFTAYGYIKPGEKGYMYSNARIKNSYYDNHGGSLKKKDVVLLEVPPGGSGLVDGDPNYELQKGEMGKQDKTKDTYPFRLKEESDRKINKGAYLVAVHKDPDVELENHWGGGQVKKEVKKGKDYEQDNGFYNPGLKDKDPDDYDAFIIDPQALLQ